MARDAVQAQLEAVEVRIHNMDQRLTERLDKVAQQLDKTAESIDKLTIQVVQFNSGMTELKGLARQILQAIDADREIAKMQASNVQQMVSLAATQQQTINTLITKLAS